MATQFEEEMLAERGSFALTPEKWSEFQSALDASVRAMPRMEALLKETSFFERGSEGERTLQIRNMRK